MRNLGAGVLANESVVIGMTTFTKDIVGKKQLISKERRHAFLVCNAARSDMV